MILKGSYVEIQQTVLNSEERAYSIPDDTKNTPLNLWAKGWLLGDSEVGTEAAIKTVNARIIVGVITKKNPSYDHDFGEFIPEVMFIGAQAKVILRGDEIE
jgi:2-amino-4-ketopentanoate thiolase alpha subunit